MIYFYLIISFILGLWFRTMLIKDRFKHNSFYYAYKVMFTGYVTFNILDRIKCLIAIFLFRELSIETFSKLKCSMKDIVCLNSYTPENDLYGTVYEYIQIPEGFNYFCYSIDVTRYKDER